MKQIIFLILTLFSVVLCFSQVGIGTTNPNPSAILDISSTTKGLLPPRMTLLERNAIVNPATGLMVYVTDASCLQFFNGTTWSNCLGDVQPNVLRCGTSTMNGFPVAGTVFNASNFIRIKVFVHFLDTYSISTNTLNGYSFAGSGTFTSLGINTITLVGTGTPIAIQTDVFTITMAGSTTTCSHSSQVVGTIPILANCLAYKNAGFSADGIYTVDPDGAGGAAAFDCYCDMTNDGGGWTLVFKQDHTTGGVFASDAQADQFDITNANPISAGKYSILFKIDAIKGAGNPYEFRLNYPNISKRNHWSQTFDPRSAVATTNPVAGYNPIAISMNINGWGGLNLSNNSDTYIDGNPNSSNWYYSIGTQINWPNASGGSPAENTNTPEKIIQLFIR